jgi:hypothetical protein
MGEHEYGICPDHGVSVLIISQGRADDLGIEHGCPTHNTELRSRPVVEDMTVDERVLELRSMDGPLYHGMSLLFDRMDAVVGRPLMTHERIDLDLLEHEMRTGLVPTIDGVLAKLPPDKPIVVVDL